MASMTPETPALMKAAGGSLPGLHSRVQVQPELYRESLPQETSSNSIRRGRVGRGGGSAAQCLPGKHKVASLSSSTSVKGPGPRCIVSLSASFLEGEPAAASFPGPLEKETALLSASQVSRSAVQSVTGSSEPETGTAGEGGVGGCGGRSPGCFLGHILLPLCSPGRFVLQFARPRKSVGRKAERRVEDLESKAVSPVSLSLGLGLGPVRPYSPGSLSLCPWPLLFETSSQSGPDWP